MNTKPVNRWDLIKAIVEAYAPYYLDDSPNLVDKNIVYRNYQLEVTRGDFQPENGAFLVLGITPGCFGDNVESIDDIFIYFIDYALADIDYWIDELEKAIEADKTAQRSELPA